MKKQKAMKGWLAVAIVIGVAALVLGVVLLANILSGGFIEPVKIASSVEEAARAIL